MHFHWLHYGCVLAVCMLQCWVVPVSPAFTDMDTQTWINFIQAEDKLTTLVLIYDEKDPASQKAEQILLEMEDQGDLAQLVPGLRLVKQKRGQIVSDTFDIQKAPALVLIRDEATALYTGSVDSSDAVFFWLEKAGPSAMTKRLTDDTFEHLTQASTGSTTGSWAVLFYKHDCSDHFTILESLGVNEKLWMNVAVVDMEESPKLAKRFSITGCPELVYFREGKMYRYEMKKWDVPSVTSFVKTWYRNVKASPVPLQQTAFDDLTEGIAKYLKTQLEGENRVVTLAVIGGLAVTLVLTSVFCCLTGGSDSKQKKE